MDYVIALRRTEEGYSVQVPGLPGCWTQGATEREAVENARDAIQEYLEVAELLVADSPETRVLKIAV